MTNSESLAKAAKELMLKEPFYGLLLLGLNKVWDTGLTIEGFPTAGICINGINYELRIHPDFWESLDLLQKQGILKHELLHLGFFHLVNYENYSDKKILNMAMDIEVNQYIPKNYLPEGGCFLESFPELKLEPKKGTRYYYEKLLEAQKNQSISLNAIMSAINAGEYTCDLPNGNSMNIPHHNWDDFVKGLDESTKKLIESQTKHLVTQVGEQIEKSRGTIPGEFEEIIKKLLTVEPAKFDWKGYIRRFVGKSTKTYTKKSRRKYNKRIPDNPGLKIKQQKHILAAIDTSGSVSTGELKEFLNELYHLKKTGSEITIIQCDTAISYIGKFDPRRDFTIHGRGGTDFNPVIDYYVENLSKYSCLMYFTDGEAPAPSNPQGHILWVLSEQSRMNDKLPGHVIKLQL